MIKIKGLILSILMSLFVASTVLGATASWLPSEHEDVIGYKIHYGKVEGDYTKVIDISLPETIAGRVTHVFEVPLGLRYYCVTAYDDNGNESDYSDVTAFSPPIDAPGGMIIIGTPN